MGWFIAITGLLLCGGFILLTYAFVRFIVPIFEQRPLFGQPAYPFDESGEPVSFPTADGLTLRGSLYTHGDRSRGLILFCPEMTGHHKQAMHYAAGLREAGFDILAFDFRNQGDSDAEPGYKPIHWITRKEHEDARAALQFIQSRDDLRGRPLGAFGVSRGGSTALLLAARHPEVRCVACDSAFTAHGMMDYYIRRWARLYIYEWILNVVPRWYSLWVYGLSRKLSGWRTGFRYCHIERWLPQMRNKAVLLISGKKDTYVKTEIAAALAKEIGPQAELWAVPGAKHNACRDAATAEYDRRLSEFFARHLGQPATSPAACATALDNK